MKVGDLVIYKPHASTYEGTGLIHAIEKATADVCRYKISWPAKPAHVGKTMTWESPWSVEVISESR
tara:strand:- start:710 stop:907 length:198 start_codon:yes stop_codon:yes gene_type:complete